VRVGVRLRETETMRIRFHVDEVHGVRGCVYVSVGVRVCKLLDFLDVCACLLCVGERQRLRVCVGA